MSSSSQATPQTTPSQATPQTGSGKKEAYQLAFNQVVDEAKLTKKEISDLWAEYQYMIDERSGRPYNNIPVWLPRKYTTIKMVPAGQGKTKKEVTTFQEPDTFRPENSPHEFSRQRFYESRSFQTALRQYYQGLGRDARFITLYSRTLMKIY